MNTEQIATLLTGAAFNEVFGLGASERMPAILQEASAKVVEGMTRHAKEFPGAQSSATAEVHRNMIREVLDGMAPKVRLEAYRQRVSQRFEQAGGTPLEFLQSWPSLKLRFLEEAATAKTGATEAHIAKVTRATFG